MGLLYPKTCYLAGSMSGMVSYGIGWRRKIEKWLNDRGVYCFNPCKYESKLLSKYGIKSDLHKWDSLPQPLQEEIIERDLIQIEKHTSFVLCYYTKPSSGTTKEMVAAWRKGIPLYIVTKRRIRGWEGTASRGKTSKIFKEWVDVKNFLAYKLKLTKRSKPSKRRRV